MKLVLFLGLWLLICYLHVTSSVKDKPAPTSPSGKRPMERKNPSKDKAKAKRDAVAKTPFDKVLDKLTKCATSSPSLVDVMQENLQELQADEKYTSMFVAAPHTAAFINERKPDSSRFIPGLRQALSADWSHPAWSSWKEIDTLFRPLKQQFVYAMMRFNCT